MGYTFGRLVNCPVGWSDRWYFWFAASGVSSPLRLPSLLTLGFSTPADHDLAKRSAKQYQDDCRLPAAPLSTSLSSLSPSYTVTLAYNSLTKQPMHIYRRRRDTRARVLHADPSDSPRGLGAARCRLRQPRCRNFDENERRTDGITVIAIRLLASALVSKMEVRVD